MLSSGTAVTFDAIGDPVFGESLHCEEKSEIHARSLLIFHDHADFVPVLGADSI